MKKLLIIIWVLAIAAAVAVFVINKSGVPGSDTPSAETTSSQTEASATETKAAYITCYEYAYAGFAPQYADMDREDWCLILVNRDYILPDGYMPELVPSVTDIPDSAKLDSRVAPHYNEMYMAAKADGITLTPVSGYRSLEKQKTNFEGKISWFMEQGMGKTEATQKAAERILPPGTSEHNAGLAMDIITADSSANFQNTREYAWLDAHAADYGFVLRYPEDKVDVTRVIYEPWHWRYVGVDAARAMKASGQCLEEYLGV